LRELVFVVLESGFGSKGFVAMSAEMVLVGDGFVLGALLVLVETPAIGAVVVAIVLKGKDDLPMVM
jgi:hypothetical protein